MKPKARASVLNIGQGGKLTNSVIEGNIVVNADLINNDGEIVDASIADNILVSSDAETSTDPWYKRPIGVIGIMVTGGLILYAAQWVIRYYF
jgi:hypothetical protein